MLQRLSILLVFTLCFFGCSSPTEYEIGEQVLLNVPFIHVRGGECFQGSAAMIGSVLHGLEPSEDLIDQQNAFLGHNGAVSTGEMIRLLRDFWRFDYRIDHAGIGEMYHYLSEGSYIIAIVDGWEHYRHATVVIGVDLYYVYVVDPVGGYRYYNHQKWSDLHDDSRSQVFVISGVKEP
jgi:hypothetical protein